MRIALIASALFLCAVTLGAHLGDPSHETTTPDVPGLTAETSKCPLSTDPTYGQTVENPIKTGGGDMYMASRQVRFLNALSSSEGLQRRLGLWLSLGFPHVANRPWR